MIKPTIGRVMWYWPSKANRGEQPLCALVCFVHGDDMVNLAVFGREGSTWGSASVPIVQEGSRYTAGDSPYCEWMPYQKGQAAKTEAAEAAATKR